MAPSERSVQVDDLDLKIIGELQVDGRRPVAEIARQIGSPKSTVQRRLDALIRDRVIMIAAYADSAKLGLGIHAHLNLRVELAAYQQVIDAVAALTEVRWVAVTTGPADIVAEACFASPNHLHEFITCRLASIGGITSVETSVILSIEKLTFHWDALLNEAAHHPLPHIRLNAAAEPLSPGGDVEEQDDRRVCVGEYGVSNTSSRGVDAAPPDKHRRRPGWDH